MNSKIRLLVAVVVGVVVSGAGLAHFPGAQRLLTPGELVAQAMGLPDWGTYILVMLAVCFCIYTGVAYALLALVRRGT